jgi:hypothetical protein
VCARTIALGTCKRILLPMSQLVKINCIGPACAGWLDGGSFVRSSTERDVPWLYNSHAESGNKKEQSFVPILFRVI